MQLDPETTRDILTAIHECSSIEVDMKLARVRLNYLLVKANLDPEALWDITATGLVTPLEPHTHDDTPPARKRAK